MRPPDWRDQLRHAREQGLTELSLEVGEARELPDFVRDFPQLESLHLTAPRLERLQLSLESLKRLRELRLHLPLLGELPNDFGQCRQLEQFALRGGELYTLPKGLEGVVRLELCDNPNLRINWATRNFPRLERLDLGNTLVHYLPESPRAFPRLRNLSIAGSAVSVLPESLSYWGENLTVYAENIPLVRLPVSLIKTSRLENLFLRQTPFARLVQCEETQQLTVFERRLRLEGRRICRALAGRVRVVLR